MCIRDSYYHILGGTLNSNENYEQKNLLIDSLIKRIKKNSLKEVIIATSATIEGQTTAHYMRGEGLTAVNRCHFSPSLTPGIELLGSLCGCGQNKFRPQAAVCRIILLSASHRGRSGQFPIAYPILG